MLLHQIKKRVIVAGREAHLHNSVRRPDWDVIGYHPPCNQGAQEAQISKSDVQLLILNRGAVFCDGCVLLTNCFLILIFIFHGRAAAHLLRRCDSNCIPVASRACVPTCLSTTLAWSRSPATPGTKTGPVGETRRISLYSEARGLRTLAICPFYIPYSALAHNGRVGPQLECRSWMHFLLLLIVWTQTWI